MKQTIAWDKIILYIMVGTIILYGLAQLKFPKPDVEVIDTTFNTKAVDSLLRKKDSLDIKVIQLQHELTIALKDRANNTKNKNNEQLSEIKRIPSLRNPERDSIWTVLLNAKDSIPHRYWDILEQDTRRKSN